MHEFAPGVVCVPTTFVNAYLIGTPGEPWALIDSGLSGFARKIKAAAAERFGPDSRPEGIFLTHGHYDHSGNARALADHWGVPIYAHGMELPYLTGRSDYPPPDPTVGGCVAQISRVTPSGAVDLGLRMRELGGHEHTVVGHVPGMAGWTWLYTPGHSPGHVAYYREADGTLLAGDALATMNMDSYVGMLTKHRVLSTGGSPFICDWNSASESVERLAELAPSALGCGHGLPMAGSGLAAEFERFAQSFTPPAHGRYVVEPAVTDERGVDWLPPKPVDPVPMIALALGAAALGYAMTRRKPARRRTLWR